MSTIVKQEDGTEVEMFSQEELQAQRDAAIEEYKTNNPDKGEELNTLQEKLSKAEEELTGLKDKDFNFAKVTKAKEMAEAKIERIAKEIDVKINLAKKEVMEGVMKDHYNETLSSLAGGDEEVKKKIEHHYKRLGDLASTKEEIGKKLRDAWLLASEPKVQDALNSSVISSGGVSKLNIKPTSTFTAEEKEFTKQMAKAGGIALEDKDFK